VNNDRILNVKLDLITEENKLLKKMLTTAGTVAQTSTSTLNYLMKNYKSAPILKKLDDYSIMYDLDDKMHFIRDIIFYHKTKDLYRYLGNFIIDNYKKEDPKEQALWNSDSSRLTYIIKDMINKKEEWATDKKGVKTNEYIIEPMLKYIKDIMNEYVEEQQIKIKKETNVDNMISINQELFIVVNLITCIENQTLAFDIIRYIAPHFYLGAKEDIKLLDSN
jgi:hypothetical protein